MPSEGYYGLDDKRMTWDAFGDLNALGSSFESLVRRIVKIKITKESKLTGTPVTITQQHIQDALEQLLQPGYTVLLRLEKEKRIQKK